MTRPTVFIVDDDAGVRDSLAMLLELKGFHTRTFAAAAAFLAEYRPEWPGCLVLDLRMPGMSGLELQADLARRGSSGTGSRSPWSAIRRSRAYSSTGCRSRRCCTT